MSIFCNGDPEFCFTELPLHTLLSEWLRKNVHLPSCTTTCLSQLGIFLLTWYAIKFGLKIFLTLTWPVMFILCGYMAVQMCRMAGNELPEVFQFYIDEFYYWMTSIGLRILGYFYNTIDPGPILYPPPF